MGSGSAMMYDNRCQKAFPGHEVQFFRANPSHHQADYPCPSVDLAGKEKSDLPRPCRTRGKTGESVLSITSACDQADMAMAFTRYNN